jgi:hypothetical protein
MGRPGEAERLHAAAAALEKELRAAFAARPAPGEAATAALRARLCDTYEALLFADYAFAQASTRLRRAHTLCNAHSHATLTHVCAHMPQTKDVETSLWKGVFYRFIEDFRRRIRKYAAAAGAGEPLAQESLDKARACVRACAR